MWSIREERIIIETWMMSAYNLNAKMLLNRRIDEERGPVEEISGLLLDSGWASVTVEGGPLFLVSDFFGLN